MPNHITNIMSLEGPETSKLLEFVKGKQGFDFEQIIPMPSCLKNFSPHMGVINRVQNAIGKQLNSNSLIARLEKYNRIRDCFDEIKEEDLIATTQGLQNFQECGYIYWHDWAIEMWGTKWNGYDVERREGEIKFETAWDHPAKIFEALSLKFPKIIISVKYADEDIGCNCGIVLYKNGKIISAKIAPKHDKQTVEEKYFWTNFALEINGCEQTVEDYLKECEGE